MKKTITILSFSAAVILLIAITPLVSAQPYGKGKYNENVPYGDETSLSIATASNVYISNITPVLGGTTGTGTSNVTVTSTDVIGFKLYVRSLTSTDMNNLGAVIPTSANTFGSPGALAVNTWGYNINGSSNYAGMTLGDVEVKSVTTPAASGNLTTFTYGMRVDLLKPAGNYTTAVVYTAVPQTN